MTALAGVGVYVPEERVPIEVPAERFGLTPMQMKIFRRYHGLGEVTRAPKEELIDLLRAAVADLKGFGEVKHRIRYVMHARSFSVVVPYPENPVRKLCDELGLEHAGAFAVGHHACSSGLLAVEVAGRLLAADADGHSDGGDGEGDGDSGALALILAGEKAFTPQSQMVPDTSFFGEGAAACLVRAAGERDRLLAYAVDLRGEFDDDSAETAAQYQSIYADALADAIKAAVDRSGTPMDEIALILPHNVNLVAWRKVCRRLGVPPAKVVLDNVATLGHVFCADAFINYRTAQQRGLLRRGERYVMAAAGAGFGAAFAALVFEH